MNDDYDGDDYGEHGSDADADDGPALDRDGDADNSNRGGLYDSDDRNTVQAGYRSSGRERRAIAALVKRYFAAAAGGDGAAACGLLTPSMIKSIPIDVGGPEGPSYARGTTCAEVATKVFKRNRERLQGYASGLRVDGFTVDGSRGVVALSVGSLPTRLIYVARHGHRWGVAALLDSELP